MKSNKVLMCLIVVGMISVMFIGQVIAQEPIKIGVIQPMTGSLAYDGQSWIHGARIAEEEINDTGGVLGRPITLIIEDGLCMPADSVAAAEKLITRDEVVAIGGCFCSSATKAVMPVVDRRQVPLVTGVSSSPALTTELHPWFFRACPHEGMYTPAFCRHMIDNMGVKSMAIIAVNDDWGRGTAEEFTKTFIEYGGKILATEYFEHGEVDYYPFLTKIKAMNADTVFIIAETQDGSMIVKQYRELGIESQVTAVGSLATGTFMDLAGAAADGIYVTAPYVYTAVTPGNERFVEKYRERANEDPGKYSLAGYDVINIIAEAIGRAGSTDRAEIRDALEKTNYVGVVGHYQFDEMHQVNTPLYLVQLQKGVPKVLEVISTKGIK